MMRSLHDPPALAAVLFKANTNRTPTPKNRQVPEKAEFIRKGTSPAEAAKRLAPSVKAAQDAKAEWVAATAALCE
jgi:hypothetical protein